MPCAGLTAGKDRQYGSMVERQTRQAQTLFFVPSSNLGGATSSFADGQVLEYWQIGKTVDCWTDSFYRPLWCNWQARGT